MICYNSFAATVYKQISIVLFLASHFTFHHCFSKFNYTENLKIALPLVFYESKISINEYANKPATIINVFAFR